MGNSFPLKATCTSPITFMLSHKYYINASNEAIAIFFSLCFVLFSEWRKEIYHLAMVIYPPRSWCMIPIRPKTYFPKLLFIERERERDLRITAPSRLRSRLQDRFEIVVPRADKDRAVEIGRNLISSPHQQISAVAHALKRPTDPPAADYDRRRHLGGGGGGGGGGSHERR